MAEIDKGLPNVKRPDDEVAEVVNLQEEEIQKGPVEVTLKTKKVQQLILIQLQCLYQSRVITLQT
jgi:hypothetical protein